MLCSILSGRTLILPVPALPALSIVNHPWLPTLQNDDWDESFIASTYSKALFVVQYVGMCPVTGADTLPARERIPIFCIRPDGPPTPPQTSERQLLFI
jgi:hypothetical protein